MSCPPPQSPAPTLPPGRNASWCYPPPPPMPCMCCPSMTLAGGHHPGFPPTLALAKVRCSTRCVTRCQIDLGCGCMQDMVDLLLLLSVSLNFVYFREQFPELPSVTGLSGLEGTSKGHLIHPPASVQGYAQASQAGNSLLFRPPRGHCWGLPAPP